MACSFAERRFEPLASSFHDHPDAAGFGPKLARSRSFSYATFVMMRETSEQPQWLQECRCVQNTRWPPLQRMQKAQASASSPEPSRPMPPMPVLLGRRCDQEPVPANKGTMPPSRPHSRINADVPFFHRQSVTGSDFADAYAKPSLLDASAQATKPRWSDEEDEVAQATAPEKGEEAMKKMLKSFACTGKSALQRAGQLAKNRQPIKDSTILAA